ncbi:uracil-DNA glycosylase [Mycoplasmopsis californica]|uniref:Uracil-DNA glycosylase n=1 Tax=Mycoplasmopsis californica TaxID=2113 RepID=A0A059XWM1_9BACT|nr:uracil-DNA glycosylase [Mycoplasmopsis californica]AIA29632.1 uracil-DNA glycosylase [Mycoplasmopsis californica]
MLKNKFNNFINTEKTQEYFKKLIKSLKIEQKTHKIYPPENLWFRCLTYFEPEDTKLIIIGQDPYHQESVADGLAFSTSCIKTPASLKNIIREIINDYPSSIIQTNSLESWAKQGVLLINSILTVRENEPLAHKDIGWEIFTTNLLRFVLRNNPNVIFGVWGTNALKIVKSLQAENLVSNAQIVYTSHPSPLSYAHGSSCFKNSGFFKKINEKLKKKIDFSLRKE